MSDLSTESGTDHKTDTGLRSKGSVMEIWFEGIGMRFLILLGCRCDVLVNGLPCAETALRMVNLRNSEVANHAPLVTKQCLSNPKKDPNFSSTAVGFILQPNVAITLGQHQTIGFFVISNISQNQRRNGSFVITYWTFLILVCFKCMYNMRDLILCTITRKKYQQQYHPTNSFHFWLLFHCSVLNC